MEKTVTLLRKPKKAVKTELQRNLRVKKILKLKKVSRKKWD
jgi:hypothetical protein